MTPRTAGSIHSVIAHMIETVGAEKLAAAVCKSVPLIYRWSDESTGPVPSILQCAALDAVYSDITGLPGPIGVWLTRPHKHNAMDPQKRTLRVVDAVGGVAHAVNVAMDDGVISANEAADIERHAREAEQGIGALIRDVGAR